MSSSQSATALWIAPSGLQAPENLANTRPLPGPTTQPSAPPGTIAPVGTTPASTSQPVDIGGYDLEAAATFGPGPIESVWAPAILADTGRNLGQVVPVNVWVYSWDSQSLTVSFHMDLCQAIASAELTDHGESAEVAVKVGRDSASTECGSHPRPRSYRFALSESEVARIRTLQSWTRTCSPFRYGRRSKTPKAQLVLGHSTTLAQC